MKRNAITFTNGNHAVVVTARRDTHSLNAIKVIAWPRFGYAKFHSRSHDAVIRVYDEASNVIETHEHKGDFKEW